MGMNNTPVAGALLPYWTYSNRPRRCSTFGDPLWSKLTPAARSGRDEPDAHWRQPTTDRYSVTSFGVK
eukprot:5398803-Amphidinium_carterae.1